MANPLQRFLDIRRGEAAPILLAALYFFCILTALAALRPTRDALGLQRGIESVRWLFMGTLLATLFVNPVFGWLVSRFRRLVFITATHAFFALSLLLFWALIVFAPQAVGVASGQVFFVWLSVLNLFVTMVFWALMADRFSLEQSKRLFGVIAVGGTAGAISGSSIAMALTERLGAPAMFLVSIAFLCIAVAAAWGVALLQPERADLARAGEPGAPPAVSERTVIGGSAFEGLRAVLRSRYLLGIAGYILLAAVISTFIWFTRLQMVAAVGDGVDLRAGLFAKMDLATQTATLLLQLLVAGRLMRRLGVSVALMVLPLAAALGFLGLALTTSLLVLVIFNAVYRAVQRAIMRPGRETLFTVVSREDKYKSKAFTDTFGYRLGDAAGAQTEGLLGRLGMGLAGLVSVVVPLAVVWAALGFWLGRAQRRIAAGVQAAGEADLRLHRAARAGVRTAGGPRP